MTLLSVPPMDDEPWPSLGGQVCDLIEERAVFGPGSLKGEPAKLDDEKRSIIWRAYEVFPKGHPRAGRRRFQRVAVSLCKGSSKALALDTPIPTASGWTTMGEIRVGETIFDESGRRCRVTHVSDIFLGNDCYEVVFRDGSSIVADAGHLWWTEDLRREYAGSVKTTTEIAESVSTRSDGARNHRIPVAGALELPDRELPIDPWILGAWLGDGRTNDAEFTMHRDDHEHFVYRVERAGYFHNPPKVDGRNGTYAVRVSTSPIRRGSRDSLKGRLGSIGLLGRKRIPAQYLRAGTRQRWELLQGLMDTDGSAPSKPCGLTYTSVVKELAEGVYELICSLGLKPTITPFVTAAGTPAWRIYFWASSQYPVFSLPRKTANQTPPPKRAAMSSNRHIVEVRKVPSVPTRCISVDSPSRLYLAGRAMIPTHNTELLAWVCFAELHPDGPVRFDGWDAYGNPVGRPVNDPYIPLVGVSEEQTEELAYGALVVVCTEGPDADLFDVTLDRILRLDEFGRADGKATALAGSPGARDGARTTFQGWDETHRLYLPRVKQARQTMLANLTKRPLDDPWDMTVTTAGELGQGSIAEDEYREAEAIRDGAYPNPDLYFHHRQAGDGHDMTTLAGRTAAVAEARGGVGEYLPGQFEDIARQWDRPGADPAYLERVWLNRWVRQDAQAFDPVLTRDLLTEGARIPDGELVTLGFDGARFRDSTAFVATDVETGLQELIAIWERPLDLPDGVSWEVPEAEVTEALQDAMRRFQVWKMYGDPPHWTETMANWAARHPDQVEEWWTNRVRPMAHGIRTYNEARAAGEVHYADSPLAEVLTKHLGAAGRQAVNTWHEDRQLFILRKLHVDRKFDAGMAAVLSWLARLEAVSKGAKKKIRRAPVRIR